MSCFETSTVWRKHLADTISYGSDVVSRGFECRERMAAKMIIDMNYPIILSKKRKLGYAFMLAEAAWILSNDNRVCTIAPFSKAISAFSDDGVSFFGAYGPRIYTQVRHVVTALNCDAGTRQAVMTIWRESPPTTKDTPCTISVQFLIRDQKLHCLLNMRSSDVWLGVPYDIFNFSMVSFFIMRQLSPDKVAKGLGTLTLYAGSSHLYKKNIDAANQIVALDNDDVMDHMPFSLMPLFEQSHTTIAESLWKMANQLKENK